MARKTYRKRKGYKKRKNGFKKTSGMYGVTYSNVSPVAQRTYTHLKYCSNDSMGLAVGTTNADLYRANGMFDPEVAVGGHQPLGFDQYSTLYDYFKIHSCRIKVTFHNEDTGFPVNVGICPLLTNSVLTTPGDYRERNACKWITIAPEGTGSKTNTVTHYVNIRKFFGITNNEFDVEYTGSISADPSLQVYWHVFAEPTDGSADVSNVTYSYQIDYYGEWNTPRTVVRST